MQAVTIIRISSSTVAYIETEKYVIGCILVQVQIMEVLFSLMTTLLWSYLHDVSLSFQIKSTHQALPQNNNPFKISLKSFSFSGFMSSGGDSVCIDFFRGIRSEGMSLKGIGQKGFVCRGCGQKGVCM